MGNPVSHPGRLLTGAQKLASSTLAAVEPNGAQSCPKSPGRSPFMIFPIFVVKNPVIPIKKSVKIRVDPCLKFFLLFPKNLV
jgi:hypothetical protein